MNDEQLLRYSRHILLPQIDYAGQEKLLTARVLIVGLGGLGSPVALYLAAAGVGELILNDFDEVDVSNLQRQIIHDENSVGKSKVSSAAAKIKNLNKNVSCVELPQKLNKQELTEQIEQATVVVDCSDNFATRYLLNEACVKSKIPLVSGSAIRLEGQVSVFRNSGSDSENENEDACYACLFPYSDTNRETETETDEEELTCAESGVLSSVVGVIGSLQATEVLKVITGLGEVLQNRLLVMDATTMTFRELKFKKDEGCLVCKSV